MNKSVIRYLPKCTYHLFYRHSDARRCFDIESYNFSGRLADELRTEQEHGIAADRASKAMAAQCMELQIRQAQTLIRVFKGFQIVLM